MKGVEPISRVNGLYQSAAPTVKHQARHKEQAYDPDEIDYEEVSLRERVAGKLGAPERDQSELLQSIHDSDMEQLSRSVLGSEQS